MQLLPQFFPGAGIDGARDIDTAAVYMRSLWKRFGRDWQLALAAYNWGPGAVSHWQKGAGVFAQMPAETRKYVLDIVTDVPVEGVLCKTLSPPPTGSPLAQSLVAPSSAPPARKSLWASLGITRAAPWTRISPPLSRPSANSLPLTSSPTERTLMTTPAASTPAYQQLLNLILSDVLSTGGTPLLTFLAAFGAAAGDPLKIEAAWIAFRGAEIGQLPTLEATLSAQLSAFLTAKVQGAMAKYAPAAGVTAPATA